jgi:serine/threonine protein kinase/Flp pilus assembly protein TadD
MSQGLDPSQLPPGESSEKDATQRFRRSGSRRLPSSAGGRRGAPQLPGPGDAVFGFRLRHELGRGAFARVFLADQADLAGRPVVLKVSAIDGDEPQTLAQLQHTHIVPIYSVHEDAALGLRAVCMPFFGGASLSQVLERLWAETPRPARGEQLVRALEAVSARAATDAAEGPTAFLAGESYVRVAAWVVARLAEALYHAHQRGVIHRDVKPSNVLLGADGQPMLLDFNVASSTRAGARKVSLGGTVAYMSPEHLEALTARDSRPAAAPDHRSDIYSLGMVLYEMLAGTRPFDQTGSYSPAPTQLLAMARERARLVPSLRRKRPDVPWGLESIARKALAPDPERRYQHADQMAEDLRRFLRDLPLKYAPELSWRERGGKWLRRHPRLASSGSVASAAALLLAAGGLALAGAHRHLTQARQELAVRQAQERWQAHQAATVRALCLVNTTTDVADHLRQGAAVCEEALRLYGALDRDDWQNHPDGRHLDAGQRQALAEDTRELLLLLAWARARTQPGDEGVLRGALALLDRAEAIEGLPPSRALWEDRADYLDRLGDGAAAAAARARAGELPPASARDHYLLATAYARRGHYALAVAELDRAIDLNPRHYWSWLQRGICRQEQGRYSLAEGDFGACIGLWPDFAWGPFNRGYVRQKGGNLPEAIDDYTAALKRDPDFVLAYLNRGMVRLELKQYAEALADLRRAADLGRDDAALHAGLGVALEGLGRAAEADAAFETAFVLAASAEPEVRIRTGWVYGFAVSARQPDRAREAFAEVLRQQPGHPQALYGQAMLLAEEGRLAEAVSSFSRALDASPGFTEARRYRAVLLARSGQLAAASQDVNTCLERDPDGGATFYAAACVAALAAEKYADPAAAQQAAAQALAFLEKALAHGHGRDKAANDPDLKGLRSLPRFAQLLRDQPGRK